MEFLIIIGAALIVFAYVKDSNRNTREKNEARAAAQQAELDRILNS